MARPNPNAWWADAAEAMVWEAISPVEAAARHGVTLTEDEGKQLFRSQAFQKVFIKIRNEFYAELGRNPSRTKATVIGRLDVCAERLMSLSQFDKAAEVLLKMAKVEGWVGTEGEVNVFAGLTQRELDETRARVQRRQELQQNQVGTLN